MMPLLVSDALHGNLPRAFLNMALSLEKASTESSRGSKGPTLMDRRRQQRMQRRLQAERQGIFPASEREHMRRPGCPCCDGDNSSAFLNSVMML
mmetsp:Transcript_8081/g.18761  ORF Transcript_8081/g.18761 Transcript_8081/m.18761 type:complete len:94 (-) Transcript_8081:26-307(-)